MEKALTESPLTRANGNTASLSEPQLKALRERQLQEQEVLMEQMRLSYISARAAVEALRAEIGGK